jgi:ABC-type sugar transport system substrate-binding protein
MARKAKETPLDGGRSEVGNAGSAPGLERPMRRSEFLAGAGKLALGASGLGLLSGGLGAATAGAAPLRHTRIARAASSKVKEIGVVEQAFAPFFTENFQIPLTQYLKKSQKGWTQTFGNENNTVPTGINLLNEFAAANDAILILSTGDDMTAWQEAVKKVVQEGSLFINHSTQGVAGATQNVLFSHKQSGIDVGNAAVNWCKKNSISAPVVGLLGNLSDAQGSKRTTWAWNTIKAKLPKATLAGSVQAIDTPTGTTGSANLLSAHPTMNVMICFNTLAGVGALTSAKLAGKTNRNTFFLGCTDSEDQTLKLIAAQNSIMQANWGAFFPASMILMARDGINKFHGKSIMPTRLIYGLTIVTAAEAKSFDKITFDPLNPKYAYVFTKYFKYLSTPVGTAQVPPGQ